MHVRVYKNVIIKYVNASSFAAVFNFYFTICCFLQWCLPAGTADFKWNFSRLILFVRRIAQAVGLARDLLYIVALWRPFLEIILHCTRVILLFGFFFSFRHFTRSVTPFPAFPVLHPSVSSSETTSLSGTSLSARSAPLRPQPPLQSPQTPLDPLFPSPLSLPLTCVH